MGMNVDASADRKYWRIVPENGVILFVTGLRLVIADPNIVTTYADFFGVVLTGATQIEIDVSTEDDSSSILALAGTSTFSFASGSYGIRSLGDMLSASILNNFSLVVSPGLVVFDMPFVSKTLPYGLALNGYSVASGKTSDYLSISHKADLSGLDYMNAFATIKRFSVS